MASGWICPECRRRFTRINQRHACGTGSRAEVLRGRSPELVKVYTALERVVKGLGKVEVVARERYVLFRSQRIFADAVIMTDAVRLAVHLGRQASHAAFFKVVADQRHVSHVTKLQNVEQVAAMSAFLKEAYEHSLR